MEDSLKLTLWVWFRTFSWPSRKFLHRLLPGAVGLVAILIAGYEARYAWHQRFETLIEREPDLRDDMPFTGSECLATLDEPATLRLQDRLPRLDGATALYPVYAAFVQAVYPEAEYDVRTKPGALLQNRDRVCGLHGICIA